jgi:large conductance mechanosensitive channel
VSENGKTPSLLSGFKAFMMRGNVIDLAVAVVIGAAFTGVVNSVVNGVINPVIGALGTQDLSSYSYCMDTCVRHGAKVVSGPAIMWGSVLGAALNFLITGAVVYFLMVMPMSRFLARRAAKQKQDAEQHVEAEAVEVSLLREIRDELVRQRGVSTTKS